MHILINTVSACEGDLYSTYITNHWDLFLLIKLLKCDLNKMPTDLDLPLPG